MICERCGKDLSVNAAICPSCGTVVQQSTTYGHYHSQEYDGPQPMPTYEQTSLEHLVTLAKFYGISLEEEN